VSVTRQQVLDALASVPTPRGVPLVHANVMSGITLSDDGKVLFSLNVDAAEVRSWESVRAQAEAAIRAIPGVERVLVAMTAERKGAAPPRQGVPPVSQHRAPHGGSLPVKQPIPGVKAIVAVASGKGGVGKSTKSGC
jgi:ATP-binding protein involved in chromosome partitioning